MRESLEYSWHETQAGKKEIEFFMTWKEIKAAIEQAGVKESDDIVDIHCQLNDGAKTLHQIRIGKFVKLAEDISEHAREMERGCCI